MRLRAFVALACLVLGTPVAPARGQTTDDFFSGDVLQEVSPFVNSRDWDTLRSTFLENTYYPCDFTWRDVTVRNVGIRSRGLGSRSSTKPGLRVDFDRYSSKQKFLGLKSIVLDNLTQDPSMLKERLTMRFLQKMGQPASRETHVRLFVNGEYFGLYASVESVDKDFLQRTLGENDGYLYEYNWVYDWRFTYLGQELEKNKEVFDPKTRESESASALYGPLEQMVRTANDAGSGTFESQMSAYLRLEDFVTHVALENVLAEYDGVLGSFGMNNFYLYRNAGTGLSRFITWDKDNTFHAADYGVRSGLGDNVLARRVFEIPAYLTQYYTVLLDAANALDAPAEGLPEGAPVTSWLRAEIDRQYEQIREAALADTVKPFTNEEFEAAILQLREFAAARPRYVRCEGTTELRRSQQEIDAACR